MFMGFVEDRLRAQPGCVCVFLAQCYQLLGETLNFFRFGEGGADGFALNQGGDEVAEEGLSVGGGAAEVAVFNG